MKKPRFSKITIVSCFLMIMLFACKEDDSIKEEDQTNEDFALYDEKQAVPDTSALGVIFIVVDGELRGETVEDSLLVEETYNSYGGWDEIFYYNDSVGYIIAGATDIYRTSNGGKSYNHIDNIDYLNLSMVDEQTLYISSFSEQILKTTDGGITWSNVIKPDDFLRDCNSCSDGNVQFLTEDLGFAYRSLNLDDIESLIEPMTIYRTEDGGISWEKIYGNTNDEDWIDFLNFKDKNNGFFTIRGVDSVFQTTDGGANWTSVHLETSFFNDASFDFNAVFDRQNDIVLTREGMSTLIISKAYLRSNDVSVFGKPAWNQNGNVVFLGKNANDEFGVYYYQASTGILDFIKSTDDPGFFWETKIAMTPSDKVFYVTGDSYVRSIQFIE